MVRADHVIGGLPGGGGGYEGGGAVVEHEAAIGDGALAGGDGDGGGEVGVGVGVGAALPLRRGPEDHLAGLAGALGGF